MKILFENLGFKVSIDEDDSVFVQNTISGAIVKLREAGGSIVLKKENSPSMIIWEESK